MRVQTAQTVQDAEKLSKFAEFLLRIGESRHATFSGFDKSYAKIPRDLILPVTSDPKGDVQSLVNRVYPDIGQYFQHTDYFSDRAILSPRNVDVTTINNSVLNRIPEPEHEYLSDDTLVNKEDQEALMLPAEFLHSIYSGGIPVHQLRLKHYTPVMLLRNLNTSRGLCNGTRLQKNKRNNNNYYCIYFNVRCK